MTAVEWLIKELKDFGYYTYNLEKLCEQAKEMEKQQIETAYNKAVPFKYGKEYYNETFNKICEHCYITSADWKSQTCSKCSHRINL